MFSCMENTASMCLRYLNQYANMNRENDDDFGGDKKALEKHSHGEVSFAVVQANEDLEDHSQGFDRLLSTFEGDNIPAFGFGFGDAVIVELLKERGLGLQIENCLSSVQLLQLLLNSGKKVKVLSWFWKINPLNGCLKRAARINARTLMLVGSAEWQKGMVGVKIPSSGEQYAIKVDEL
ncbi:unnamed protein product [Fraxinus pennsylvanica]|uniref:histidine--tRNA ligase n=1 Tax=Fraxinus pennsylvanica TaxID=56036 RepID=A0AAD2A4H4_9LAMI|nr:unnamed protein product [Fraxinus pennsylvanica]